MKISLITPSFNSAATIADTIESVRAQNYPDLEYIVMDGGSTDGTKEIVAEYMRDMSIIFVSEPDKGIYDAMNKGIRKATGDIVGILNSDDFFASSDVLKTIVGAFADNPDSDAVYGDLQYVSQSDTSRKTRFWRSGEYDESNLDSGWIIPHPTFFAKRSLYAADENVFDTRLSLAADYELLLRLLKIRKIKVTYVPKTFVNMREGGASAGGLKQRIQGWKELRRAWTINSLRRPKFFILRRVLSKFSQFIKKTK